MKKFTLLLASLFCFGIMNAQSILYNSGPLVNSPGMGAGGADVSNTHDGITLFGFGHAVSAGFRMADDFIVPANTAWNIDSIIFFAYQTQTVLPYNTISTITEVNAAIWDGSPASGGSIVFGDTTTDRLNASYWSGIYRASATTLTNAQRPIMRNQVSMTGCTLTGGTYWVSWQTGGTLASGPWAPPITIAGITATGNGLQFNPAGSMWTPAKDTDAVNMAGTGQIQGMPFIIYGSTVSGGLNDSCITAVDLTSSLGQPFGVTQTTGPYDNDSATTGNDDPSVGFECFGEPDGGGAAPTLDNTLWFTFTGDGGLYFIETGNCGGGLANEIDDGDTQIAIYEGTCGALTPLACSEDGPSATATYYPAGLNFQTTAGTTYYMIIDGFNFNGALSNGQFCVNITQLLNIPCGDPQVSSGTGATNNNVICFDSTFFATVSGAVAPTVGAYKGFSWLVSTADISGNSDPLNDPSFVGGSGIAAGGQNTQLLNNGAVFPTGIYYFTPCVYGNATDLPTPPNPPTNVFHLMLDPTCTYTGTSIMVNLLAAGDPLCNVGIAEHDNNGFGISNLYPVPVRDNVTFTLSSKTSGNVSISVKDNIGKEVLSQQKHIAAGENKIMINLSKQSAGVYFIMVTGNESTVVSKFVKE